MVFLGRLERSVLFLIAESPDLKREFVIKFIPIKIVIGIM